MSLGRVSESPGEAVSPLPSSPLFLWWIHVFFALRVGRGLGVPWSRCYLWSWVENTNRAGARQEGPRRPMLRNENKPLALLGFVSVALRAPDGCVGRIRT